MPTVSHSTPVYGIIGSLYVWAHMIRGNVLGYEALFPLPSHADHTVYKILYGIIFL